MWIRKISLAACVGTLAVLFYSWAAAAPPALSKASVQIPIEIEVVSSDGKPVADVSLTIAHDNQGSLLQRATIIAQGKTDTLGKFQTNVTFVSDRFFHFSVIAQSPASGVGIGTLSGQLSTDLPAKARITLQPPATARLRVLQPDGSPAANLKLCVGECLLQEKAVSLHAQTYVSLPQLPGILWQTQSNDEGYCEIANLPPSSRIYLKHDDPTYAQPSHRYEMSKWFDTTAENILQLALASSITGRIQTPDGTPIPDAGVYIIENRHPYVTAYGTSVFSDTEGRFILPQVPASDYKLTIHVPRHLREEWIGPQELPVTTRPGETLDLKNPPLAKVATVTARMVDRQTGKEVTPPFFSYLPAGSHEIYVSNSPHPIPIGYEHPPSRTSIHVTIQEGERQTVDFKLTPVNPATIVTGTVFDPTGKPEHNATIVLACIWSNEFPAHKTTDADGQFSIVPPKDANSLKLYAIGKDNTLSQLVDTTPGAFTDVHLKSDGFPSIRGKVTNDLHQPIKNARLQWNRMGLPPLFVGPPITTQTDHEGNYAFPRLWAGETYNLSCQIEGHGSVYKEDIQPKEGETITLDFTLPRATESLSGVVLDSTGKPVAKAWINGSGNNQSDLNAQTDNQGRFHFKQAVPGAITLRYGINNEDLHVEASRKVTAGQQDLQLVLPEAEGSLGGLIVDPSGKPLPHAKLWTGGHTLKGNEDGKFQLKGIKPGWHDLDVTVSDGTRGARTKRFRIKTDMNDLHLVVPDQQPAELPYPEQAPNMIGKPAPALNFALWIRGAPYTSEPTPGKVRIIDFWNTQCGPCIATFPKIETFLNKNRHPDLEFIALHAPNPEQEVREFFESRPKLTFPVAISPEDSHDSLNYGVRGNPCYVVIDKSGKIVSHGHDWTATTQAALTALQTPSP